MPMWVLLAFAGWTLATLFASVGVYRWSRILTGRASVAEWRADLPQGSEFYQRAMRAHMNCVENLPVYGAIAVAGMAAGASGRLVDALALVFLAARISQTLVHLALRQTNAVAALRFAFFFVQFLCLAAMGIAAAARAAP
jgi:uncharacterized MAPEG superfamily protein